jgi:acetylglutamate kinase
MAKLYIIKIGGNIIDDDKKLHSFLRKFAGIEGKKILVHGGGKLATSLAGQLNIPQQVIDGRRITDAETLKVVTMVYTGLINKGIVATLQSFNCNALGLCGADGNSILAHQRRNPMMDYGFVGDIDAINTELITDLLAKNITPVFAPVTHDQQGQLLNTNADTIAQEIGKSLGMEWDVTVIYTFDKKGVLANTEDENSVIPVITPVILKELEADEKIYAGMLPKLHNAFAAISGGVKEVMIGNAEELEQLIKGETGTSIVHE